MLRNPKFATIFVTVYLLVYCILFGQDAPLEVLFALFVFSPFLVIWMAYTILRYDTYEGKEFEEDEEWGYQDRERDSLGIF